MDEKEFRKGMTMNAVFISSLFAMCLVVQEKQHEVSHYFLKKNLVLIFFS